MTLPDGGVLQIVPHLPGTFDGVGDYALNLARALSNAHNLNTTFLVSAKTSVNSREGYRVISGFDAVPATELARAHEHVILHYVNYGYQPRGVPFRLRAFVKDLRRHLRGHWVTTFHELYASGPPWTSAFWLRPLQVKIAWDIVDASTSCVVSNVPIEQAIHKRDPGKKIYFLPVMSNFGEPALTDFTSASQQRWAICGGSALVSRSVELFRQLFSKIPREFRPAHLDVVGGREGAGISSAIAELKRQHPDLSVHHYAEVGADLASEVLRQSSFGFIDYFGAGKVWPGMLLKSTAFAALCAHGVIPVLSHREEPIAIDGDSLPGPYVLDADAANFPGLEELPQIRRRVYDWYHAHAAADHAARTYVEALR